MATLFRLLALLAPALWLAGCNDPPKPDDTSSKRSEAVRATAAPPSAPTPKTAPETPAAKTAPRRLCEAPPASAGRSLPGGVMNHLEASGAAALPNKIPSGGRFTWLNLWAAWCKPCKEEIPRLKAWEAKLASLGTPINMVFLSLDDDERQARQFLESQPPSGLRASFWLPEDRGRAAWMEALRMKADPQLPLQILIDPQGRVACVIEGAVDDPDFAQVQAIVARR